jgi:hypothetical protein
MGGLYDRIKRGLSLIVGSSGKALWSGISHSSSVTRRRDGEEWLEAFQESPWLAASVGLLARGVSSLDWKIVRTMDHGRTSLRQDIQKGSPDYRRKTLALMKEAGDVDEMHDHPMLSLLRAPCSALTGRSSTWLGAVYDEVMGEAFFLIDRYPRDQWMMRGVTGRPVPRSLWPVPPNWVRRTPDQDRPTFDIQYGSLNMLDVPITEVLWKKRPDVKNPYGRGVGSVRCLADELNADESAARLMNYSFYNKNRPEMLVTLPGWEKDSVKAFSNDWTAKNQGLANVSKTHFVNVDAKVQTFSQDFRSMQVEELRKFTRDTIRQVVGPIPPELLGILDSGSNRSTAEAAEFIFAKYVLSPRADDWRDFWTQALLPEFDSRACLEYESPVQEDKNFQLSAAGRFATVVRVNEQRKMAALPPLSKEEGGEHFLVAPGLSAVASLMELVPEDPPDPLAGVLGAPGGGLGIQVPGATPALSLVVPGATPTQGSMAPATSVAPTAQPERVPATTLTQPSVPGGRGSSLPGIKGLADLRLSPDEALAVARWSRACGGVDISQVVKAAPIPVTQSREVEYVRRALAFLRGSSTASWNAMFGAWGDDDAENLDKMLGVKEWAEAGDVRKAG